MRSPRSSSISAWRFCCSSSNSFAFNTRNAASLDTGAYSILKLAAVINNYQNHFSILPGYYFYDPGYPSIAAPPLSYTQLLSHLSSLLEDIDYLSIYKKQLDIGKDFD